MRFQAHPARRGHHARRRRPGQRLRAVHQRRTLRRQPVRRRLSYGGAVHDQSGTHWRRSRHRHYGFTTTPSNQGGTDYAQGGAGDAAMASRRPGRRERSVMAQVNAVLAKGPLDPQHALPDPGRRQRHAQAVRRCTRPGRSRRRRCRLASRPRQPRPRSSRRAAAGRRRALHHGVGMLDVGKRTPFGIASPAAPLAHALSSLFNTTLNAGHRAARLQVITFNTVRVC